MKPEIILHMLTSIDGKSTGKFLDNKEAQNASLVYYDIHKNFKANGFICGRETMDTSFNQSRRINLDSYCQKETNDSIKKNNASYYAISIDPKGLVGWTNNYIEDDDPGYNHSYIIEVLARNLVDTRYLSYLDSIGVSYIFAGDDSIDLNVMLEKLNNKFGISKLLLEGGPKTNEYFFKEDLIDQLSIVIAPVTGDGTSVFNSNIIKEFKIDRVEQYEDCTHIIYRAKKPLQAGIVSLIEISEAIRDQFQSEYIFLDKDTSELLHFNEEEKFDDDEEMLDMIESDNAGRFVALPTQSDINGYRIMEDFIETLPNNSSKDQLSYSIRGKGAFRHFKDTLYRLNLENKWYDFEDKAYTKIAKEFLNDNNINYQ